MDEMNMLDRKLIEKSYVQQHDMTDCGAACLLSLIRYYGGDSSILHLREISGTSNTGTTLLGLYQAARTMGFDANGAEANGIPDLIEHGKPCVLAVVIDKVLSHFVVCYGYENDRFIISDPAKGVKEMTEEELGAIWTRKCLLLEPNATFEKKENITERKKNWVLNLIREDFGLLGASIAIGLVISVLGMVMAVFSQKLVDDVLPSHDVTKLVAGIILVLVLLLGNVIITAVRGKLLILQSRDFNNRIIRFFFDKLLHLPKTFFDTRKTGDMVARLNDTRRIQNVIGTLAGTTIINILVVLVSVAFIFIYSWKVAVVSVVCMPVKLKLLAYEAMEIDAVLVKISAKGEMNNGAVKFPVEVEFVLKDQTMDLRSGYSATAEILLSVTDSVLTLPEKCINFKGDTSFVYVTDSLKREVTERVVSLGLSDGDNVEITDGIGKDDFVITNYHD